MKSRFNTTRLHLGLLGVSSLALLFCATISGCNIVAPIGVLLSPPPKVPKVYELPKTAIGVVFIDDRDNKLPRRALKQSIGTEATVRLLMAKAMANMVDSKAAQTVAAQEKPGEPMNVTLIGRGAKADVVIWVAVDSFFLTPDGQTYSPGATLRIKVIDAVTDKKLWPEEKVGYKLTVMPAARSAAIPKTMGDVQKAEQVLAELVGAAIAELFYDEKVIDSSRVPGPSGQ